MKTILKLALICNFKFNNVNYSVYDQNVYNIVELWSVN